MRRRLQNMCKKKNRNCGTSSLLADGILQWKQPWRNHIGYNKRDGSSWRHCNESCHDGISGSARYFSYHHYAFCIWLENRSDRPCRLCTFWICKCIYAPCCKKCFCGKNQRRYGRDRKSFGIYSGNCWSKSIQPVRQPPKRIEQHNQSPRKNTYQNGDAMHSCFKPSDSNIKVERSCNDARFYFLLFERLDGYCRLYNNACLFIHAVQRTWSRRQLFCTAPHNRYQHIKSKCNFEPSCNGYRRCRCST